VIDHVANLDSDGPLPEEVNQVTVLSLMGHVLASEGVDEPWQLGVQFIDGATMQAAHLEFMGIDETTDIMTFPYADDDDVWGDSEPGGDLMISVDTARENAEAAGWTLTDELLYLVTHGLLHLLGWDDHTDEDRAAMLTRQHELMGTWPDRP
jgi:rRNA maturation RNase YbeY